MMTLISGKVLLKKYCLTVIRLWCLVAVFSSGSAEGAISFRFSQDVFLFSVQQVSTGNYIAVGSKSGDALVASFTNDGRIKWARRFNLPSQFNSYFNRFVETQDGSIVVLGARTDQDTLEFDPIFMKLTPTGKVVWKRAIPGAQSDLLNSIALTQDGGFLLSGQTSDFDALAVKINRFGKEVWSKSFTRDGADLFRAGFELSDGSLVLIGMVDVFGTVESAKGLFVNLSADGQFQSHEIYTIPNSIAFDVLSVTKTSDDGLIVGGSTLLNLGSAEHSFLFKTNSRGQITWQKLYVSSGGSTISAVAEDHGGGVIVSGTLFSLGSMTVWC